MLQKQAKEQRRETAKDPAIAALLNFFFSGAGYIYGGRRRVLGWLLLVAFLQGIVAAVITVFMPHMALLGAVSTLVGSLLVAVALAIDGYISTRESSQLQNKKTIDMV